MKPVNDHNIVSVLDHQTKPIVIKFEANWCQLCKAMTPILLELEKELGDKVEFFTANVDHAQLIAQRYKINQIPALVAIDGGIVTAVKTGAAKKSEVREWIDLALPTTSVL